MEPMGSFAGAVEFEDLVDVNVLAAVLVRLSERFGAIARCSSRLRRWQPSELSQIDGLADGKLNDGQDGFRQLDDAQGIAGGDGAHADLVLVVRFGAAAEDAGGHGELQGFGGQGGSGNLHGFEAVMADLIGAGAGDEIGGEAVVGVRVAEQGHLAVDQVGDVGDGDFEHVHGHAGVAAVEVSAVEDVAGVGVEEGIVVGAVDFGFEQLCG